MHSFDTHVSDTYFEFYMLCFEVNEVLIAMQMYIKCRMSILCTYV